MLEMIVFSVTIEFVFFERCAQSSQHQLPGFVDASPQFHWDLPEIEHFQCDSGVETRIDLGSRYVNGNTDSRPATPALHETYEIFRNTDLLERMSKYERARFQQERILFHVIPQVGRIPQGVIDPYRGQILGRLTECCEFSA